MRGKHIRRENDACTGRITPADAGKTLKEQVSWTMLQDHPRGCGENHVIVGFSDLKPGSPPRMRGKRQASRVRFRRRGITPADAGKTEAVLYTPQRLEDHPRGCGENLPIFARDIADYRITPADAGKTVAELVAEGKLQDHPRGCGENSAEVCKIAM